MKNKKFNFNLCTFWTAVGADFVDNYFGEAINTVGNVVDSVVGVIGKKRNLNLEVYLCSTGTGSRLFVRVS